MADSQQFINNKECTNGNTTINIVSSLL